MIFRDSNYGTPLQYVNLRTALIDVRAVQDATTVLQVLHPLQATKDPCHPSEAVLSNREVK